MIVSIVRFRSKLSDEGVQEAIERRAERYRRLPGLAQKIYLRFRETGEFAAIYVWETEEALRQFKQSDLAGTIASGYEVETAPSAELADVCLVVDASASRASVA